MAELFVGGLAANEALQRARDRLIDLGTTSTVRGAGRELLVASRKVYELGRDAYNAGNYSKAGELARAADAWAHAVEHIQRAAPGVSRPAADEKKGKVN